MIRTFIAFIGLAMSGFAAEVPLINMVPSQATVIAGIHADLAAASPLGQYLVSRLGSDNKDFQDFVRASGFDPLKDVREVVVASAGQGPGLVLARGVFPGPTILQAVQAKTNGTITRYSGIDVLDSRNGRRTSSLAFADGSLAIAGEPALVRSAIDQRNAASALSTLAPKASELSARYHAWALSNGAVRLPLPGTTAGTSSAALQGITQTSGGLTFASVVRFEGQAVTQTDQNAQALADLLRFMVSLIQMNDQKDPNRQNWQPILDSLTVSASSNVVNLSFAIAETDLERLIPQQRRRIVRARR